MPVETAKSTNSSNGQNSHFTAVKETTLSSACEDVSSLDRENADLCHACTPLIEFNCTHDIIADAEASNETSPMETDSSNPELENRRDTIELQDLHSFYSQNSKNLKFGHLNINSIRHKFEPLKEALSRGFLDILFLQETKLDGSFPDVQFSADGFKLYRKDVLQNTGGIMAYIRSDLVHKRRQDIETELEVAPNCGGRIELLIIEINVKSEKWCFCSVYKQPKVHKNDIVIFVDALCKRMESEYNNFMMIGDLNVNFPHSGHCLTDLLDVYGLKNIVNAPTCAKGTPTLIDVAITNVSKRF